MSDDSHTLACPVCQGASTASKQLPADQIIAALAEFTESSVPASAAVTGYTMYRCSQCELEFSQPAEPAQDGFYAWLDKDRSYYTSDRWEWHQVSDIIRAQKPKGRPCRVLEFGAGGGHLLNQLRSNPDIEVCAVERSDMAVQALRDQGIEAHRPDQADAAFAGQSFDFVMAFHCLEHVPDPVEFVAGMCRWAGPEARVFVSVPYSPMFFEHIWFDPLNHPPHHMTRWNQNALAALARRMQGQTRLHMPPAFGLLARARMSLAIHYLGPHWYRSRRRAWLTALLHPLQLLRQLRFQARRERVNGRVASDVVLMEIVRRNSKA